MPPSLFVIAEMIPAYRDCFLPFLPCAHTVISGGIYDSPLISIVPEVMGGLA
ncbi:MAG: hypothetical protein ACLSB7_07795 [Parabacteroides distasonis]